MTTQEHDEVRDDEALDYESNSDSSSSALDDLWFRLKSLNLLLVCFYVYLGLMLSILTFIIPPFQKSDEVFHYLRTVSVTNGDLVCSKDADGRYYFNMKRKYANLSDVAHTFEVAMNGNARYDFGWLREDFSDPVYQETIPVYEICNLPAPGYLPNAVGVLLGKPFTNPLFSFYLGRLVGAMFFVGVMVWAFKVAPERYRLMLYLYAALPMVLHQATSITYDVVQLALFPLIFAYLAKFTSENRRIPARDLVIFALLIGWSISIRLIPYVPLLLLLFAIRPSNVASSRSRYAAIIGGAIGLTSLVTLVLSLEHLPRVGSAEFRAEGYINAHDQVDFILHHPDKFIDASYRAMQLQGDWILRQGIGVFGWIDAPYSFLPYYVFVFLAGLVLYRSFESDERVLNLAQIGVISTVVMGCVAALFVSLYAVWSPVGSDEVGGLQGRYFLGLLPFSAFAVSQVAANLGMKRFVNVLAVLLVMFVIYNTYRTVDLRYFG